MAYISNADRSKLAGKITVTLHLAEMLDSSAWHTADLANRHDD